MRVLYERHPLAGALIKLTDLAHDAEPFESHVTDAEGRAEFTLPEKGAWLLNVVWTTPKPAGENTDFETVFSSLSFGFPVRSIGSMARPPDVQSAPVVQGKSPIMQWLRPRRFESCLRRDGGVSEWLWSCTRKDPNLLSSFFFLQFIMTLLFCCWFVLKLSEHSG